MPAGGGHLGGFGATSSSSPPALVPSKGTSLWVWGERRLHPLGLGGVGGTDTKAQVPAGGLGAATRPSRPSQDEDIMSSMQIFENTI